MSPSLKVVDLAIEAGRRQGLATSGVASASLTGQYRLYLDRNLPVMMSLRDHFLSRVI